MTKSVVYKLKNKSGQILSMLMAIIMVCSVFPVAASAASTDLPDDIKGYVSGVHDTSTKRLFVWQDSELTVRNPNEWIDASNDEVVIHWDTINRKAGSISITYPTKNASKTRFIPIMGVLPSNNPDDVHQVRCTKKVLSFKNMSLSDSSRYGSVFVNDVCWLFTTPMNNGNGTAYRIVYPTGGNTYKIAFISTKDYNNAFISTDDDTPSASTSTSDETQILQRLDAMMNGSWGNGDYKTGAKYTGLWSNEQCKGYAKAIHKALFSYNIGSTNNKPNNYKIAISSKNTNLVGSLTSLSSQSDSSIQNLFDQARAGDFIQVRRSHGGSHSMIFLTSNTSSVTVLECNVDGKNGVVKSTYSWVDFRNKNEAVSVYTAKNYYLH